LNLFSVKAKKAFLKGGIQRDRAFTDLQHLKQSKLAFSELFSRVYEEKNPGEGGEREGLLAGPIDGPVEEGSVGGIELTNQSFHTGKSD
jgi:hypothetical protein